MDFQKNEVLTEVITMNKPTDIVRKFTGVVHQDYTHDYTVKFKPGVTVGEFILSVLMQFQLESGVFRIDGKSYEYKEGKLVGEEPAKAIMLSKVLEVECSGAFTLMNYTIWRKANNAS